MQFTIKIDKDDLVKNLINDLQKNGYVNSIEKSKVQVVAHIDSDGKDVSSNLKYLEVRIDV